MKNEARKNVERENKYYFDGSPLILIPDNKIMVLDHIIDNGVFVTPFCKVPSNFKFDKDIFELPMRMNIACDGSQDHFKTCIEVYSVLQELGRLASVDFVSYRSSFGNCLYVNYFDNHVIVKPRLFRARSKKAKQLSREGLNYFGKEMVKGDNE